MINHRSSACIDLRTLGISLHGRNERDRKSTRLNSSHTVISYAVFCLEKKKNLKNFTNTIPSRTELGLKQDPGPRKDQMTCGGEAIIGTAVAQNSRFSLSNSLNEVLCT